MAGRLWRSLGAAAAFVLLGQGAAVAGVPVLYEANGQEVFRFEAPDNWTVRTGQETPRAAMPDGKEPAPRIISMMPEGGADRVWTGLWSPPGVTGLDGGIAHVRALDTRLLKDTRVSNSRDLGLPAGPARIVSGTGSRLGTAVVWDVLVLALPSGRVVLGAFVGEPDARAELEAALTATVNSIRSPKER